MDPNSTGRAHVTRQRVGSITHLRIRGPIDETFSPQALSTDLLGHVILDLGHLERISSFGVRRWIEFVGRLPPGALGLYAIHAPPIVVDQLNMVEGFSGISRVLSVLAPYRCNGCGEDRVRVVDVVKSAAALAENRAPEHSCGVCGGPLEFADTPSEFFDFIRTQSNHAPVEPVIERYLNSLRADAPHEGNTTAKLIEGDLTFFALGGVLKSDLNVRRLSSGLEGRIVYDFGHVTRVDEGAVPRLGQILSTASEHAKVFLWRVPPPMLEALSRLPPQPQVSITTLSVPSECVNCGERSVERIEAATYLDNLLSEEGLDRQCPICGGTARLAQLKEYVQQLMRMDMVAAPPEIEMLEQQALSQYLSSQVSEMTPSGRGSSGEGTTPGSRLQILKRIGRGGMAEVFLARQQGVKGFEKYVVLKKVLGQFAQSTDFVEMLFAEARANARLTHPNIVQTFDVGMMDGMAYITMEYVRGPDMKRLSLALKRKNVKLPIEHALRIAAEIAAGLHYAHAYVDPEGKHHPMVHRDVSPHNILISLDGAIKLSDFGIAKVQGESEQTQAGVLKGKISYVSPEAVAGMPLDARNDVFGLGVVLFEMLTGQLPFKRDNDAATLRAIVRDPAPNPSELDPRIPHEISQIILWALEKDPVRRIQSASALREAIETAMVRCGWASSPFAVAQYFRETLSQELAEFGPSTGSMMTPVPPVMAVGAGGSGVVNLTSSRPSNGAATGGATDGELSQSAIFDPDIAVAPPAGVASPAPMLEPEPPTVALGPSGPVVERSAIQGAPRPLVPPVAPRSEVRKAERSPPPKLTAAPTPRPTAARRPKLHVLIAGAILLVGAVVAGLILLNGGGRVDVHNLGANETLYVGGVRMDPSDVRAKGESLMVAVAREGRLIRFGTANSDDGIDAMALVDIGPEGGGKASDAFLEVNSNPPGCAVEVSGEVRSGVTPLKTTLVAGNEHEVSVICPNRPAWRRWVAGIPGQRIELLSVVSP